MKKPRPSSSPGLHDEVSGAATSIAFAHHEVHEGQAFAVSQRNTALGAGATLVLVFRAPPADTRLMHLLVSWTTEGKGRMEIREGATWTTGTGTLVTVHCRNRESPGSSLAEEDKTTPSTFAATGQLILNPIALTGGTVLPPQSSFAGNFATGGARGVSEWVLNAGTTYAVTLTNEGASALGAELELDWYEHEAE